MPKKQKVKHVAVHYKETKKDREILSLNKKASVDVGVSRMVLGAQGIDGLRTVNGTIAEQCNTELMFPNNIQTYKAMSFDPTIAAVNNFYNMMMARAEFKFIPPEDASEKSIAATAYLNYCKDNMDDQTWSEFISGIGTYRIFGYSIAEKVWTTVKSGQYKGKLKWKSLAQRSQDTIKDLSQIL